MGREDYSEEWNDAIDEAKEELGYDKYEWIEDWDEVVQKAKEIIGNYWEER